MKRMKRITSQMVKAIYDFELIENGDKVAVSLSGGKDSSALLQALVNYQKYNDVDFELVALTMHMGLDGFDTERLAKYCASLDVPFYVIETQAAEIIFDIRQEKNPCSLCSNLRHGAINGKAIELGCNKVATAHHADDAIETLFMNMISGGKLATFKPKTYLSRDNITLIRPFAYVFEKEIKAYVTHENGVVIDNPCPKDGVTTREEMKTLIKDIEHMFPKMSVKSNLLRSLYFDERVALWDVPKRKQNTDTQK